MPSLYYTLLTAAVGMLMAALAHHPWTRRWLLAAPQLFSFGLVTHKGPSQEQVGATSGRVGGFTSASL
jgi:hypothetical protein